MMPPMTAPEMVPMPPITMSERIVTDRANEYVDGDTELLMSVKRAPPSAAYADDTMKAITRVRGNEIPTSSAATSLSRMSRMARPVRLANRFAMKKKAMPATTMVTSAMYRVVVVRGAVPGWKKSINHRGAVSSVGSCNPESPPVQELKELKMKMKATAKASVIPAR